MVVVVEAGEVLEEEVEASEEAEVVEEGSTGEVGEDLEVEEGVEDSVVVVEDKFFVAFIHLIFFFRSHKT